MVSEHSVSSLFDVNKLRSKVLPVVRPCQIDPCLLIVDEEHTSSADKFPALVNPVAKAGDPPSHITASVRPGVGVVRWTTMGFPSVLPDTTSPSSGISHLIETVLEGPDPRVKRYTWGTPASDAAGLLRFVSSLQEPFHGFVLKGLEDGDCAERLGLAKPAVAKSRTV